MTEEHHKSETYGEMDLGEILRELYSRKWTIIGVTLLVGIAVAGYTLTKPNIYSSSAALIVREPSQALAGKGSDSATADIPILSIETLLPLATSTETTWTLFEELWEEQALGKWRNSTPDKQDEFTLFQKGLITSLKKQQGRAGNSVTLLPILTLTVRAQHPVDAQLIANRWAKTVEEKSKTLYTSGVEALNTYIGDMYGTSSKDLVEAEEALDAETLAAALELKTARLTALRERAIVLEGDVLGLDVEIKINESAIKEGARHIAEQQCEGEWIGTVAEYVSPDAKDAPYDVETLAPYPSKIVKLVMRKIAQTESLRTYREKKNLLGKQEKFDHYKQDLKRILTEKAKADDELPALQATLAAFSAQLEDIPEKIILNKAITNDALWTAHVQGMLPEGDDVVPLKSEIMNPLYQSTQRSIVTLTSEVDTLKGSSEQLALSAEIATSNIRDFESEIDAIEKEIERRTTELEKATVGLLEFLREDYLNEMKQVETLSMENTRKREEMRIKSALATTIAEELVDLDETILASKLKIKTLTRTVDKANDISIALASKAAEIALLKVSAEEASNTGTSILYAAQVNPLKVAPVRSKVVLAGMMVAFILCSSIVCLARIIKT